MNEKKRILLIATGGTIASVPSEEGLRPAALEAVQFPGCGQYEVEILQLLQLDSTNIQPEEWSLIARCVYEKRLGFDGVVVAHGTDTMAYTASVLTFMLPGLDRPVVLTGAQLPAAHPLSDAQTNLQCAFAMAAAGAPGVFIAFDRKVFLGCRAVKVRTVGFHAFESVNLPAVGTQSAYGLSLRRGLIPVPDGPCRLEDRISSQAALVKLIPGADPRLFRAYGDLGCRGLVVEAFGAGGVSFVRRDVTAELRRLVERGVTVAVCSQCLYEPANLTAYEVGRRALAGGVLSAGDMTTEAAVTKLMWLLGQDLPPEALRSAFLRNLHGELGGSPLWDGQT
ncbi:MAG: asparaginase [Oscillospiraceae bacterium]|nr:asparaginase [Oscillospiraceae bacterium]